MATKRWRIQPGIGDDADDDAECGSHDSYPGRTFRLSKNLDRRIGQCATKLHGQRWDLSEDEQVDKYTPPLCHISARSQLMHQRVRQIVRLHQQPAQPSGLGGASVSHERICWVSAAICQIGQQVRGHAPQCLVAQLPGDVNFVSSLPPSDGFRPRCRCRCDPVSSRSERGRARDEPNLQNRRANSHDKIASEGDCIQVVGKSKCPQSDAMDQP